MLFLFLFFQDGLEKKEIERDYLGRSFTCCVLSTIVQLKASLVIVNAMKDTLNLIYSFEKYQK